MKMLLLRRPCLKRTSSTIASIATNISVEKRVMSTLLQHKVEVEMNSLNNNNNCHRIGHKASFKDNDSHINSYRVDLNDDTMAGRAGTELNLTLVKLKSWLEKEAASAKKNGLEELEAVYYQMLAESLKDVYALDSHAGEFMDSLKDLEATYFDILTREVA